MHELRAPLTNLLKKGVKWDWSDRGQKSFEEILKLLTSLLSHVDQNFKTVITEDVSESGTGTIILHKYRKSFLNTSLMLHVPCWGMQK